MSSWLLLILLAAVALWLVGAYNGLVSLKNQTLNAFKQIDVQLKRRHDLIPNLVNAVKGAMDFERSTLEAVIQARNQAVQVNASGPGGVKRISQAENALSSALQRLLVVVEQYPQLKATSNVGQLQEELASCFSSRGSASVGTSSTGSPRRTSLRRRTTPCGGSEWRPRPWARCSPGTPTRPARKRCCGRPGPKRSSTPRPTSSGSS